MLNLTLLCINNLRILERILIIIIPRSQISRYSMQCVHCAAEQTEWMSIRCTCELQLPSELFSFFLTLLPAIPTDVS